MRYFKISLLLVVVILFLYASLYSMNKPSTLETIQQSQTISRSIKTQYGALEISVPEVLEYESKEDIVSAANPSQAASSNTYMRVYFGDVSWFEIKILSPEDEYNRTGSYLGKTKTKHGYLLEKYSINNDGRINSYPLISDSDFKCQIRVNATKDEYDNYKDLLKSIFDTILITS